MPIDPTEEATTRLQEAVESLFASLRDGTLEMDLAVSQSRAAPPSVLLDIARDLETPGGIVQIEWSIYEALARHPASDDRVFEILLSKSRRSWDGMVAMARHPNASPRFLAQLARQNPGGGASWGGLSGEARVREAIAANPTAPGWLLSLLATDSLAQVRARAMRNPATPIFALRRLVASGPLTHAESAAIQKRFRLLVRDLGAIFRDVDQYPWAPNFSTSATRGHVRVSKEASDPSISEERLLELATHDNPHVRRAVAENYGHEIPECLLDDPDPSVRLTAIQHPSLDPDDEEVRQVAESDPDPDVRYAALERGSEAAASWVRRVSTGEGPTTD